MLSAHTNFVYSLFRGPELLFSCSEDRTLRVWDNAALVQTIAHPSIVWCVTQLPNGDVATGGSDGTVRLFTQDPSRIASDEDLIAFEGSLQPEKTYGAALRF